MDNIRENSFEEILDTIQVVSKAAKKDLGEDSLYCVKSSQSALVSVCDGCGGLGARKYQTMKNHTGAYMASRLVSGAIHDWYHHNWKNNWKKAEQLAVSIDKYIRKVYSVCEPYALEKLKIRGSMVRRFPTTLAMAYAEKVEDEILLHILWAGDSRIYLLDSQGLAQLSKDDLNVEDALENLTSDGAMTNVLSADGNYNINCKTIKLTKPAIIFAATDGCFGYIPSPMEFEFIILNSLVNAKTPEEFRGELYRQFSAYAGDDFAFGMMSFKYGNYENTRKAFAQRLQSVKKEFIDHLQGETEYEEIQKLWGMYKPGYERYLR